MGKFDGILICSDADGTFCGENTIEENSRAVRYFTENGGRFTFATGRAVAHMRSAEYFDIINAPVCLYNGGIVYDYQAEKVLYERRLGITVGDFVEATKPIWDLIPRFYYFDKCGEGGTRFVGMETVPDTDFDIKAAKLICGFDIPGDTDKVAEFTRNHEAFKSCCITKSWSNCLEFNSDDASKGNAIDFIKEYLGDVHTTIGVGDYENDLELLKHADIGVAVGNAIPEVKAVADVVVKPCNEYAIKDLIERLDKGEIKVGKDE